MKVRKNLVLLLTVLSLYFVVHLSLDAVISSAKAKASAATEKVYAAEGKPTWSDEVHQVFGESSLAA